MHLARKRVLLGAMMIVFLSVDLRVAFANYAPSIHARDDIKMLKTSLMVFEATNCCLPTKEEGLHALVSNPIPPSFAIGRSWWIKSRWILGTTSINTSFPPRMASNLTASILLEKTGSVIPTETIPTT